MLRDLYQNIRRAAILPALCITLALPLAGCFTGIEGTKKITLSKEDRRHVAPTAEELLLAGVKGVPHTQWEQGKQFYVTDERASVLLDASRVETGRQDLQRGDTLTYMAATDVRMPDGTTRTVLLFDRRGDEFRHMAREAAAQGGSGGAKPEGGGIVMSDAIPGLIDPAMLGEIERLLKGRTLWTLSNLWTAPDGGRINGMKYDRVTVRAVQPGTIVFPVRIDFADAEGREGSYLMNMGNTGTDSRGFATLFSLSDPRENHPSVTDEVWLLIQQGNVRPGMTKEECRLAKGNPSDVYDGHDYSKSMLLWVYPDATTLYFEDDVLTRVKGY